MSVEVVTLSSAGALLREARHRAGLTQAELARRAGVTQSVISAYESSRRQPALPTLAALIEATGLELSLEVRTPPARLERLTGPIGRIVRQRRREVISTAAAHGVTNLRVFGSVARSGPRRQRRGPARRPPGRSGPVRAGPAGAGSPGGSRCQGRGHPTARSEARRPSPCRAGGCAAVTCPTVWSSMPSGSDGWRSVRRLRRSRPPTAISTPPTPSSRPPSATTCPNSTQPSTVSTNGSLRRQRLNNRSSLPFARGRAIMPMSVHSCGVRSEGEEARRPPRCSASPGRGAPDRCAGHEPVATMTR